MHVSCIIPRVAKSAGWRRAVCAAAAVAVALASGAGALAAEPAARPTLDQVFAAWNARAATVRSFRATIEGTATYAKGAFQGKNRDGLHSTENSHDFRVKLSLDGDNLRYEKHEWVWDEQRARWFETDFLSVSDGQTADVLFGGSQDGARRASGHRNMEEVRRNPDMRATLGAPFIVAFRATHPHVMLFNEPGWSLLAEPAQLGDRACWILSQSINAGELEQRYWIDAQSPYVVRRRANYYKGKMGSSLEVEYQDDPAAGPIPAAWQETRFDGAGGTPKIMLKCRTTEFELNPTLDAAEFRIEKFPPGAQVQDYTDRDRPPRKFEALATGELKEVAQFAPDPGPVLEGGGSQRWWWLVGVGAGVAALAIAARALRGRGLFGRSRG